MRGWCVRGPDLYEQFAWARAFGPLPTLVWGFVCQEVCRGWLATSCEVGVVGRARADQAGAARPGRRGSHICGIGERCHPEGRSAAEQPASAGLTTIDDRATGGGLRPPLWIGCRHRFDELPIGSEASSPAAAEREASAATLYSGDPCGSETMMQSCASAAKLRRAGPFYMNGTRAMGGHGTLPPRIVIGSVSPKQRRAE